jgi:hypothetical protein
LNVLEIGPGSGMLGLLANYFKINYSAFDITNAFSIHIMSLYSFLFKKNFKDFGLIPFSNKEITHKNNTDLSFFPWWHFLNTKFSLPKFDFIIMNACFFEIEEKGLYFIFNRLGSHEQRQNVMINDWGSKVFSRLNNEKIIKMESALNIKKEQIINYDNIHIPETQCLFSYKLSSKPLDFDTAAKKVEIRPGYELDLKNKKLRKNNIKEKFSFKIMKKIKNIFLGKPEVEEPRVLGTSNIVINKPNKNHNVKTIDYNQFLLRIKKIEKSNGKPCFTEDELFGYYLNSKEHW